MAITQERLNELKMKYGGVSTTPAPTAQPKATPTVKQAPVVTASPVQKVAPAQVPKTKIEKPMAVPQQQPMKPDAPKSFAGKVFNILGKPSAAVGGYMDATIRAQEASYKQGKTPASDFGLEGIKHKIAGIKGIIPGIKNNTYPSVALQGIADRTPSPMVKKIASNPIPKFVADAVSDPLNAIPISAGVKAISKIPGVKQVVSKGDDVVKAVSKIPAVKNIKTELGIRFAKEQVVPKEVLDTLDDVERRFGQVAPKTAEKIKTLYSGLDKKETEAVAEALQIKELAGKGKRAFKGYKNIVEKVGKEAWDTRVAPVIEATQEIYVKQLDDQLKRKLITKDQYTDFINKAYYPSVGFESNKTTDMFSKVFGKHGQSFRGYMKRKKGATGFTLDAGKATLERELRQVHDNLIDDAMVSIRKNFGKKATSKGGVPDGWMQVDVDKAVGSAKRLKGYYFPPEVAKHINQVRTQTPALMKAIDTVNKTWKPFVTGWNPKYIFNNALGNIQNSFTAGMVDPKRYKQALFGGFSKAERELVEKAGISGTGGSLNEIVGSYDNFFTDRKGSFVNMLQASKGTRQGPIRALTTLGTKLEDNAKAALFLDTYEKMVKMGEVPETAIKLAREHANKHLFDYRNGLTPFESRYLKKIIPFYTFTRKNLPLQLENVYKRTGKVNQVLRTVAALNGGELPSEEGLSIPFTDDGQGNKRRLRLNLPVGDILDPYVGESSIVAGQARKVGNMVSPFIKAPVEAASAFMGKRNPKDTFTGKDITNRNKTGGQKAMDWIKYMTVGQIPQARTYEKIVQDPSAKNIIESLFIPGIQKRPRKDQAILDAVFKKKDAERLRREELFGR